MYILKILKKTFTSNPCMILLFLGIPSNVNYSSNKNIESVRFTITRNTPPFN